MKLSKPKYIFVTGGVASSLGKGIISASIARLLQARGYSVTIQKLDPYINVDPGTLNPYEHGECYVTEDGAETDLDLGHYERFTNQPTSKANNVTTGKIYKSVIEKERKGEYLGKTVQVIPHITDEIKRRIQMLAQKKVYDVIITEIGGTVGDIESLPFIESVRQLRYSLGYKSTALVHLTLIPYMAASGELKTKPTQHSVKALLENGLQPDILVLRAEHPLSTALKRKVALFCNVDANAVMESIDVPTIYEVPLKMHEQHLDEVVLDKLNLTADKEPDMAAWSAFVEKVKHPSKKIEIALVGKYTELPDAYKSICESFIHAGAVNDCKVKLRYVNSEKITRESAGAQLGKMSGILVAPGFGNRGIEGKIEAVRFARENGIPFLDLDLKRKEIGFSWKTDSRDAGNHLNCYGAKKVSLYVGQYIKNHVQLEDKRQNAAYAGWNDDYTTYIKHLKEGGDVEKRKGPTAGQNNNPVPNDRPKKEQPHTGDPYNPSVQAVSKQ